MTEIGQGSRSRREELVDALLDITASRGLDRVSVREVASAARVSVGAVQHYFATKDEMLLFAFRQVVQRIRTRIAGIRAPGGPRQALGWALRELLPLDRTRLAECRAYLAFAARAATSPELAAVQEETLTAVRTELQQALTAALAPHGPAATGIETAREARLLLAVVDGLMFHAVTAPAAFSSTELESALDAYLDRILPAGGTS